MTTAPITVDIQHGTVAGYVAKCPCRPCCDANTRWAKQRKLRVAQGTWAPFVPAEDARAVINQMRERGMSAGAIRHASGVALSRIASLIWETNATPTKVRRETYDRLVRALQTTEPHAGAYISSLGTHRRIEALCVQGWTFTSIGAELGCSVNAVSALHMRPTIRKGTADKVKAVYDALSLKVGPAAERYRQAARDRGWAPPLAWDDDAIDNPEALPDGVGYAAPLKLDVEEVRLLVSGGDAPWLVAKRVGYNQRVIREALMRAGHERTAELFRAQRS